MEDLLNLIENRVYVNIIYERGEWYYVLHELPSKEDIDFANSGECQDGDLWLDSNQVNQDWYDKGYPDFLTAFQAGIEAGKQLAEFLKKP